MPLYKAIFTATTYGTVVFEADDADDARASIGGLLEADQVEWEDTYDEDVALDSLSREVGGEWVTLTLSSGGEPDNI